MAEYAVVNVFDDDLYWVNDFEGFTGWGDIATATVYTQEERDTLSLPNIDGAWKTWKTYQANPLWDNDLIQFARLIREIAATQELDENALLESMDLEEGDLEELFNRAHKVWETAKENL